MPFSRPTIDELKTWALADLKTRLNLSGTIQDRSVVAAIANLIAGGMHLENSYLEYIARQVVPLTADIDVLEAHGTVWGITRKAPTHSEGVATFSGTNGTVIPEGTILLSDVGDQYITTAAGTIASGTAAIATRAVIAGSDYILLEDSLLRLQNAITGVTTITVTTDIDGGTDIEGVEDYRARIINRIQKPPMGGTVNDYVQYALAVPGVTRAWCYENYIGIGSVGVTFVCDDLTNIIPDSDKVDEVEAYILDPIRKPITADIHVFAPDTLTVNFTIQLAPNTPAVQQAVTAELNDLFNVYSAPGTEIKISQVRAAISAAAGENDNILITPTANIEPDTTEIARVGTITFQNIPE